MKKAMEQVRATGGKPAESIRIKVEGTSEVGWQISLKPSVALANRRIPGSLITNILCASSPEQRVELRLTRFVCAPDEQLGFHLAQA